MFSLQRWMSDACTNSGLNVFLIVVVTGKDCLVAARKLGDELYGLRNRREGSRQCCLQITKPGIGSDNPLVRAEELSIAL